MGGATDGAFDRRASTWQSGLIRSLLTRNQTAGVFEPEDYVPGDNDAMDDLTIELADSGHELLLATEGPPVGMLVNLSSLRVPRNPSNVFGSIYVVPYSERQRLRLVGICTPFPTTKDLSDLRNGVQGSRLVRAERACEQLGVVMKIRRTRRGQSALSVELDLTEDSLRFLVNLREGTGWDRPLEQLEGFARTLSQVSDALQGANQSQSNGGCYIATAVYGSYDAPEVRTLRGFRDTRLRRSPGGRALIKMYYLASPPLANYLRDAPRANRLVRQALDLLVARVDR